MPYDVGHITKGVVFVPESISDISFAQFLVSTKFQYSFVGLTKKVENFSFRLAKFFPIGPVEP